MFKYAHLTFYLFSKVFFAFITLQHKLSAQFKNRKNNHFSTHNSNSNPIRSISIIRFIHCDCHWRHNSNLNTFRLYFFSFHHKFSTLFCHWHFCYIIFSTLDAGALLIIFNIPDIRKRDLSMGKNLKIEWLSYLINKIEHHLNGKVRNPI